MASFNPLSTEELRKLHNNPHLSDLTIRLKNGDKVYVHKSILSMASARFRRIFLPGNVWADRAVVQISDHADHNVVAMLQYVYGHEPSVRPVECLRDLSGVYGIASEYEIAGLAELATKRGCEAMETAAKGNPGHLVVAFLWEAWDWPGPYGIKLASVAEKCCEENIERLIENTEFKDFVKGEPWLAVKLLEKKVRG